MLSLSPWPPVVCVGILLQGQAGVPFSFPTLIPPKQAHNLLSFQSCCLTAGTTRKPIRHSRSKESWEAPRNLKIVTGSA